MPSDTSIPKRALFKPAEVCSIAGVKAYILRSWEAEFQTLGQSSKKDGSRVYRREDVELVLRIKELVFSEGLTLGAARRKIESQVGAKSSAPNEELLSDLFATDVRDRLEELKKGLLSILDLLSAGDRVAKTKTSGGSETVPKSRTRRTKTGTKTKKKSA